MMLSKNFLWNPKLPKINESNYFSFIENVNNLLNHSDSLNKVIEEHLECNVQKGNIKSYKRINVNYKEKPVTQIGLLDFRSKNVLLKFFGFKISIAFDSPMKLIEVPKAAKQYYEFLDFINSNNKLISVQKPWKIKIIYLNIKKLKTQFNVQIKFSLSLSLSKYKITFPDQKTCNHKFKLFYNGIWNWCLVWECIYCGFLCHCKCFENVVKSIKENKITTKMKYKTIFGDEKEIIRVPRINWGRQIRQIENERTIKISELGVDLNNLPFYENACEVCQNIPSTQKYCHKMYARSEFELRYGAYIKKKFFELKLEKSNIYENYEDKELEMMANNLLREELGFKRIGERFITETELYRIVNSIFSDMEVLHHYRPKWLKGQELDIYVPKLKLGIEYDGIQHFKPIAAWGGEEGLKKNQERDKLKESKCEKQNVKIIRFSYKENELLTKNYVAEKINQKITFNS